MDLILPLSPPSWLVLIFYGLGAIGQLMKGAGLDAVFTTVAIGVLLIVGVNYFFRAEYKGVAWVLALAPLIPLVFVMLLLLGVVEYGSHHPVAKWAAGKQ